MGATRARYKLTVIEGEFAVTVPTTGRWSPCDHGTFASVREAIGHATSDPGRNERSIAEPRHPRFHVIRVGPDIRHEPGSRRRVPVAGVDLIATGPGAIPWGDR